MLCAPPLPPSPNTFAREREGVGLSACMFMYVHVHVHVTTELDPVGTFPGAGIPSSAGCRGAAAAVSIHYAHVRGPVLHAAKGLARGGSREGKKKGSNRWAHEALAPRRKRGHCMAWHALTYITYASPMRRDVGRWVVEGCCCCCWLATGSIQWVCWNVVQRREGRERDCVAMPHAQRSPGQGSWPFRVLLQFKERKTNE